MASVLKPREAIGRLQWRERLITTEVGQALYAHVHLERGERSELATLASELL